LRVGPGSVGFRKATGTPASQLRGLSNEDYKEACSTTADRFDERRHSSDLPQVGMFPERPVDQTCNRARPCDVYPTCGLYRSLRPCRGRIDYGNRNSRWQRRLEPLVLRFLQPLEEKVRRLLRPYFALDRQMSGKGRQPSQSTKARTAEIRPKKSPVILFTRRSPLLHCFQ